MEELNRWDSDDEQAEDHEKASEFTPFLDHTTRVHMQHAKLKSIIDGKQHWIFAMVGDCISTAMEIYKLHRERCEGPMNSVWLCCVDGTPAFLAFPKSHLRFDEIETVLGLEFSKDQAELEKNPFFTISMSDPAALSAKLNEWFRKDHILN